ncbi:MAG: hypothetical protein M3405_09755 [Acidobacteriota bacterium]|nr:hypothetical protein [Acidobacteriota bacterium]
MNTEVKPTNPVVKAIAEGTAPKPAQLAAARGILPLPQTDLVEALVILAKSEDKELSETAGNTLKSQDENQLKTVISSAETAPHVLDYFATLGNFSQENVEEIYEETGEQRQAAISKILGELKAENDGEIAGERISMISQIMSMNIKDRVKMAMKGNREARMILIRDPNKIVAQAVIQNPKITEQEVEGVAKMRTVPEDVLRQIAINRKWARNYVIFHNLALNPRTPVGNAMNILPRLQLRDLISMIKNRNVPDAIRKHAQRLSNARVGR